LCAQRRFEEAKPLSAEALQLFRQELGKFNEYTKTAFTNYYAILKELKLEDEIKVQQHKHYHTITLSHNLDRNQAIHDVVFTTNISHDSQKSCVYERF
jgi:hypothetical protein